MIAKRYVQLILIGIPLSLSVIGALVMNSVIKSDFDYSYIKLVKYQKEKLINSHSIDIALVGDSSLGNAIDAKTWSADTDKKIVSLALTGKFGYGGSYSFFKQAIEKGASTVLIMHTLNTFDKSRVLSQDHKGYLYTVQSFGELLFGGVPFSTIIKFLYDKEHMRTAIKKTINRGYYNLTGFSGETDSSSDFSEIKKNDYWPQGNRKDFSSSKGVFNQARINNDKIYYLTKLYKMCEQRNINCFYMHGPVHEIFCKNSKKYILRVNELVRSTGIKLLSEMPYCIENEKAGDASDHVLPEFKHESTRYYLGILKKHIIL